MERTATYVQRHALMQRALRSATYALVLLMPFSLFFAIGPAANENVLALYAQRGFYLSDLPLALLLVLALTADIPWRRGPALISASMSAICVLAFLSVPQAVSSSFAFYVAVRWLLALFVYVWFLQPVVPARRLAIALALSLGVHAVAGIAQVLVQGSLGLPGELTLAPATPGAAVLLVNDVRWLRAYGLAFHPNVLGGFLAVGLLLLAPWLQRLPAVGLWWLLWTALLLTFSRAAWLAVALTLPPTLVVLFFKRREWRRALALAMSGALVLSLAFLLLSRDQIMSRLGPLVSMSPLSEEVLPATDESPLTIEAYSLSERKMLAEVAWEIIEERPHEGVGAGNFPLAMWHLRPQLRPQSVHNIPLLLAAEVGLLGAALWLLIGLVLAARFILHARGASPWLLSAICAWLALVVVSFFDSYPWSLNSGLLLTAMVLGLGSRAVRDSM